MKIGLAGLAHETHTFLPEETGIEPFERDAVRGRCVVSTFRGTNTVVGGFVDACEAASVDVELVPSVHARGGVSGTVVDEVYRRYVGEICETFGAVADDLDGVLLFLHGAMVTKGELDPETALVRDLRSVVGPDLPIVAGMDLHGNVGSGLIEETTAVCAYRSSPHVDQNETGRRAAWILLDTIAGDVRPTTAVSDPGLVVPSVFSATTVSPAKDLVTRAVTWQSHPEFHDVTRWTDKDAVLDVSVFFGFAWSDVPQLGVAPVAVTDDDPELAETIVEDVATLAWAHRDALTRPEDLYSVEEGVSRARSIAGTADGPVLLLDHADRLAETTFVLRELLEHEVENAAVPLLHDPEAVEHCRAAGEGSHVSVAVGSKTSDRGGGPVVITGTVETVEELTYTSTGPMKRGERVTQGPTAIVRTDEGVWVQLTSRMDGAGLTDIDPIEQYGYAIEEFDVIVSKSKTHFRGVFEDLAAEIVIVDAPEYSPADLSVYEYRNVPAGVYPITHRE